MSERIEHCNCCDAETGRAGVHDDSLFRASEGPFCEECYESWPEEIINQRDALAADNQRLREAACDVISNLGEWCCGLQSQEQVDYVTEQLDKLHAALAGSKEGDV